MTQIVTVDFDNTLSKIEVQKYVSEILKRGVDVWVLTSRFDDLNKDRYEPNPSNDDLWEVVNKLGIEKHKVRFNNMQPKADYLAHTKVVWHLDDDELELDCINSVGKVGINVLKKGWKVKCENLLK